MGTIGRSCLIPKNIEQSIITKHVYRVTLDDKLCSSKYDSESQSIGIHDNISFTNATSNILEHFRIYTWSTF